jgi:hypothetical protein
MVINFFKIVCAKITVSFIYTLRVLHLLIQTKYSEHNQRLRDDDFVIQNEAAGKVFRFHKNVFKK